jgi:hypothetical protein
MIAANELEDHCRESIRGGPVREFDDRVINRLAVRIARGSAVPIETLNPRYRHGPFLPVSIRSRLTIMPLGVWKSTKASSGPTRHGESFFTLA